MTDLVERLRYEPPMVGLQEEAADEIERLRAELEAANRRAEFWKAEHLAGNVKIDALSAMKFVVFNSEDCWIYQGDGNDKLDSLVCPVVILPKTLRGILVERDELRAVLAHWMFFIESEAGCPEQLPWVERARKALGYKNTEDA